MATVLVWENNMVPNVVRGLLATASDNFERNHSYPGHAALSVDDVWNGGTTPSESYVTWVPEESLTQATGTAKAVTDARTRHATSYAVRSLCGDLALEHYLPDHVVRVTGLSATKMQAEWAQIKAKGSAHWRQYRKNCSTIVGRVLRAGGAGGAAAHNLVWTPKKVLALALKCGGTAMTWDQLMAEVEAQGGGLSRTTFEGAAGGGAVRMASRATSTTAGTYGEVSFPWRSTVQKVDLFT